MDASTDRFRVLVADDSTDTRLLMRLAIEQSSDMSVVAEAADGAVAVELAAQHRPHVAIVDLGLPRLHGLDVVERIRSESPDTRVVVVSGRRADEMRGEALARGACDYIEKGTPLATLAARVRAHCDGSDGGVSS